MFTFSGMARAFSTPAIDASVALYIPDDLRNVMYSIVLSGNQVASILVNTLMGFYCQVEFLSLSGWQISFFILCLLGVVWIIFWLNLKPKPTTVNHLKVRNSKNSNQTVKTSSEASFKTLLKSSSLWCLFPCNIAAIWTTRLLMYYVPSFYRDVFRMPLMKNGIYSSLPFIALCLSKTIFSAFATWIEHRWFCVLIFLFVIFLSNKAIIPMREMLFQVFLNSKITKTLFHYLIF